MTNPSRIEIRSGGQTGVDRAALDVAIELGVPHGGWVPRGRLAEDGPLPERYTGMRETESVRLDVRTRRNVRDSDATLILTAGEPAGGTALTIRAAQRLGKPLLVLDLRGLSLTAAALRTREWLASLPRPLVLNVAGPRASTAPDAYDLARGLLLELRDVLLGVP